MTSLRRFSLLGFLLIIAGSDGLQLFSQAGLVIGGYQQVSETRITRTVSEYVYRATLVNNGTPVGGATATATSVSPYTTIVDGSLTFGAVGTNGSVLSSDTFSFRHDRTVPFDWANIQWTIAGQTGNRAPVANAGPDQTVAPGALVSLNGSGSTDADGNPLTFAWSLTTRPAGSSATLTNPTSVTPSFVADVPGNYVVSLVVNDGLVNSAPDTVSVSTRNSAPVANAGPDQTVALGATATLNGSGSSDADGNPLTFAWTFVSRPAGSTAVLSNATSVTPSFVADRSGAYVVQLIVNDGLANSPPDTVTVSTTNSPPVANAGPDQTVALGATVTLNGSASTDADGNPLTFGWSFVSRPAGSVAVLNNAAAIMPTFTADRSGTYVVQLIVNDGLVASAPDTVTISTLNSPPVANAGPDQSLALGSVALLDGSGSSDPDGNPLTFNWAFTSRPAGSTATLSGPTSVGPSFVLDRPGSYVIQLVVNDGLVNSAPDTVTITTTNSTPVANAGPDQIGVSVGNLVTLFGGLSSDPDGHPLTFAWSFTSRPAGSVAALTGGTSASPTFTPDLAGDYLVQLVVNDGFVNSPPDTVLIRAVNVIREVNVMAADANASEAGPDPGTFTFTRSAPAATPLQVFYTVSGTAASVVDYGALSGVVTIAANEVAASVSVVPVDDATFEGDETVVVTLSSNAAYTIGTATTATVVIADNDVPSVTVTATDGAAGESGPNPGTFTFTRTGATSAPLVVSYALSGTATNGADYTALSGTVTISTGLASASVTVTPIDDAIFEGPESVVAAVGASSAYSVGAPGNATITIDDNDVPTVSVQATDAAAAEAGANSGTFTFTRTGLTTSPLNVLFTVGGTAINGTDYAPTLAGSVTIPAGQASAALTITPGDDADVEGDETVLVTLSANAAYAVAAPGTATVTIADNDVPTVSIAATDSAAAEAGTNTGAFTVTRTGPTTSALNVSFTTAGTATNGTDYTPTLAGTVTIPAGQGSAIITITPVDDAIVEGDETVVVSLSANAAYSIAPPGSATITIADNDVATVTLSATDANASEAGPDPGVFTFTRTGPTGAAFLVRYSIGGNVAGDDFTPSLAGTITIPAGQAATTLTITPVDDAVFEGSESLTLTLVADPAYTIGSPATGTVTIADNDVPTVTITATDAAAAEAGANPGTFTFTRTGPTTSSLNVSFGAGGTATNGTDFTPALTGTVTIPVGQASATLTITPVDDANFEGDETVVATLTANAAYSIGTPGSATITIADNDVPTVTIEATDASASEAGANPGTFTFTRTGSTTGALNVSFGVGGTATNGTDYTPTLTGTVTIPTGQSSATLTITPVDDASFEGDETAVVTLAANSAYSIGGTGTATVTIADNDLPTVTVAATDASAAEAAANPGTFTFTRTGATASSLSVSYAISGTATNGTDYTPTLNGTISIPAGQASVALTITPTDDALLEGDETAIVTLSANAAYTVGASNSATVTIADNEVAPVVTVTATVPAAAEQGSAGPTNGVFQFSRTGATTSALTVQYVVGGTATSAVDYTAIPTDITFAVGQTTVSRTIAPIFDGVAGGEGDETVVLTLTDGASYDVGTPSSATVTIADALTPVVTVAALDANASENADSGTFRFTRTVNTFGTLSVTYSMTGTATNGTDYTTLSGTVTFPNNQAVVDVQLTPILDAVTEASETAILTLVDGADYNLGTGTSATVTIADFTPPVITVTAPTLMTEAGASENFVLRRTGAVTESLTVQFTIGGTANNGVDYATVSGQATFAVGSQTVNVTIDPVVDTLVEGLETVILTLTDGTAYDLGTPSTATATIGDALVTFSATDADASEDGPDPGAVTVSRTGDTTGPLTVTFTVAGSATRAVDYADFATSVTIPAGQSAAVLTVTPILDALTESVETVIVSPLNGPYVLGGGSVIVNIADSNTPIVTIAASDPSASEVGPDTGTFTISRTGSTTAALVVNFTRAGSATAGSDYPNFGLSVTIPATQSSATITITPVDDALVEGSENVVLTLTDAVAYNLGAAGTETATVTIADGDVQPVVTVAATDANASEVGPDTGTFTFTRTGDLQVALVVNFTRTGSATAGGDYNNFGLSLTIPANQSTAAITVTPVDDALVEGTEDVIVTLTDVAAYDLGAAATQTATITIADGDVQPVVTVAATDANASEVGPDTGTFTFTRTGDLQVPLVVNFTRTGSATAGADYNNFGLSVTIPANQSTAAITVTPVDDALVEGTEDVIVTLTDGTAYDLGAAATQTATIAIADGDVQPIVTVAATDALASEIGPDTGTFTFTRTGDLQVPLVVNFTRTGSATAGADYNNFGLSVTIPANQSTATITATPVDDALVEGTEDVIVTLTDGTAYDLGAAATQTATITIDDGDVQPIVTVVATDTSASEVGPDPGTFTFTRTGDLQVPLVVNFTRTGSATAGADYNNFGLSVTIPANQSTATITATPVDDALVEGTEDVVVTLTDGTTYDLGAAGTQTATISIADGDVQPIVTVVATDASASEVGPDPGTFTFTRTGDLQVPLVVNFTRTGSATGGADFNNFGLSVTIPANQSTATITAIPVDDALVEGTEDVIVTVTDGAAYDLGAAGTQTATITITDGDVQPVVTVVATDASASEAGPDPGTFTFTRTGDLQVSLVVTFARAGTATAGADYNNFGLSVTIPANQTSATITATPVNDALAEGAETIVLTLTDAAQYDLGAPGTETATVTIADQSTPLITIAATDNSASEVGSDTATFTFTRTGDTTLALNGVAYNRTGTATPGTDFTPNIGASATINFAAGSATATLTITPVLDGVVEGSETVILTLVDGAAYDLGASQSATAAISDNSGDGGPLVNGALHTGEIATAGEVDSWTFTATVGDRIAVFIGEIVDNNDFRPFIRLNAPNGTLVTSSFNLEAAQLDDVIAPATGTYTVLVSSADTGSDGTGTYRLTMTHTPGPITTSPGDEGGPLTNGGIHTGTILQGDMDVWTFTATAGDRIAINIGEIADTDDFRPWIRLWAPNGASLNDTWNLAAAQIDDAVAPVTGTYLVLVASADAGVDGTGTYRLTMAHTPGPITVSSGDQGGPLTNGGVSTGEILRGDLDVWTFTANAGERIAIHVGELTDANDFRPWIRLWGPAGTSNGDTWNLAAAAIDDVVAPATGTYLVLVASADAGVEASGTYQLTMTHTPGPITVPAGDEGGPLTNGGIHTGTISLGELDVWTFTANAGDRIAVNIGEIADNNDFRPWIRLWAPNNASIGDTWNLAAAQLDDVVAPVTGTYLLLVASADSGLDGSGTYRLTMAHTPGPITVSAGDDGGPITNGGIHTGAIVRGDLDVWTFTANAGERIAVNIGELTDPLDFRPWIRLWAPNGASVGDTWNLAAAELDDVVAPVTGTYLLLVASADAGVEGSGTYQLTMAHTPGPITVSAGDEGGPLTNGGMHTGTITRGDLDIWTFTATAGDRIAVNIGETADNDDFRPWIRLWAPNNSSIGDTWNVAAAQIDDAVAPVTGTYLVLVASADSGLDGAGAYRLSMTHTPGPITVSSGDEGGPMINGATHAGTIVSGDLDVWTFTANSGERIAIHIGETTDPLDFRPWIRLWAPNGASLGDTWNVVAAQIDDVVAPVTGTYLVLVGSADAGVEGTGTYQLTMTHTPGPVSITPGDEGGPISSGSPQSGAIGRGDLDVWTFNATAGTPLTVQIAQTSETDDFRPWIRLWTPAGLSIGDVAGVDSTQIGPVNAPVTGTYLVLVASADSGVDGIGTYTLTVTGASGGASLQSLQLNAAPSGGEAATFGAETSSSPSADTAEAATQPASRRRSRR